MTIFEDAFEEISKLDVLIHAGAGSGHLKEIYDNLRSAKLILIEPLRDNIAALRASLGEREDLKILEGVLATRPGTSKLYNSSLPRYNSTYPPKRLYQIYPGIGVEEPINVKNIALSELENYFHAEQGDKIGVILEVVGAEAEIMLSLESAGLLDLVQLIIMRTSDRDIFDGPEISPFKLVRSGRLKMLACARDRDPEFLWCHLEPDKIANHLVHLEKTLASCQEELVEKTSLVSTMNDSIGVLEGDIEALNHELTNWRDEALRRDGVLQELKNAEDHIKIIAELLLEGPSLGGGEEK